MTTGNAIGVADLIVDHPHRGGTIRAVSIPSWEVPDGGGVAVVGPSGCGKSTLLGVLAGLAVPSGGTVTIGSTEVSSLSEADRVSFRRTTVGMVYQSDNLLPFLTVTENLLLQLAICGVEAHTDRRVAEVLARVGVGDLGDRLPDGLSGGQRQRVGVARSVVHEPSVVLADEPTGALDEDNAGAVIELLVEVTSRLTATLVVVTHDPQVAEALGRVVTLRDGTITDDRHAGDARRRMPDRGEQGPRPTHGAPGTDGAAALRRSTRRGLLRDGWVASTGDGDAG